MKMENGSYYGIDFGTTNTSVCLYKYEKGVGAKLELYGKNGMPFSSCIAISKTIKNEFRYSRDVKENVNKYSDNYIIHQFPSF